MGDEVLGKLRQALVQALPFSAIYYFYEMTKRRGENKRLWKLAEIRLINSTSHKIRSTIKQS